MRQKCIDASILRLIQQPPGKIVAGTAMFRGKDLLQMTSDETSPRTRGTNLHGFRDPMTSLNPVMTDWQADGGAADAAYGVEQGASARTVCVELLEQVGIPRAKDRLKDYPLPIFRRHAPTRDDCHGAELQSADCYR